MGERRMVSRRVVETARFLRMSATARLLYYDLIVRADDDGVVEAFPVIWLTGAKEKDLNDLESAGFIKILNEDLVSYIRDWKEHNWVRKDRKTDSIYKDLVLQILPEEVLIESTKKPKFSVAGMANASQVSDECQTCQPSDSHVTDMCQTSDNQMATRWQPNDGISKDKLSKDKLREVKLTEKEKDTYVSKEKNTDFDSSEASKEVGESEIPLSVSESKSKRFVKPSVEEVRAYCKERANNIDAEEFVDYYSSNGWYVGRSTMKDWKATVRTWESRERKAKLNASPSGSGKREKEKIDPQYLKGGFEVEDMEVIGCGKRNA